VLPHRFQPRDHFTGVVARILRAGDEVFGMLVDGGEELRIEWADSADVVRRGRIGIQRSARERQNGDWGNHLRPEPMVGG